MSANFIKAEDKLIKPAPVQSQWTNTFVRVSFRINLTWFSYSLTENFRDMKIIFKMSPDSFLMGFIPKSHYLNCKNK